jgi:hypothetical protein
MKQSSPHAADQDENCRARDIVSIGPKRLFIQPLREEWVLAERKGPIPERFPVYPQKQTNTIGLLALRPNRLCR